MSSIEKKHLLVVEGDDEKLFYDAYLKFLSIRRHFDIEGVGGRDKFRTQFPILKKSRGFNNVTAIGFVRDAEDKPAKSAFYSICSVIKNAGLIAPKSIGEISDSSPRIGIFISPDNQRTGMLEDLCLEIVSDHPAMPCVDAFAKCIGKIEPTTKNMSKSKMLAFLAAMPDDIWHIGHAAQKKYFDFESPVLDQVKSFLNRLINIP